MNERKIFCVRKLNRCWNSLKFTTNVRKFSSTTSMLCWRTSREVFDTRCRSITFRWIFSCLKLIKILTFWKTTSRSSRISTTKNRTKKLSIFLTKKKLELMFKNHVDDETIIHEYCNFFDESNHKFFQWFVTFNTNSNRRNAILTW